ncbi:uracil-DNA glycosylase family protein [Sulfitobacter mediterraneus]|uniref:uracil-DNA glycosylase family protein n=1 Tax=Sulfitobacter mediterraneus TaxID=83219 RepID=UPI0021A35068|nr:uracil-DNA glycosylase family protein [Sulfitobacter mediterraneus]UWR10900.1 hypothetical protein K3753_16870 [Sulfitobacter mediterraneus]
MSLHEDMGNVLANWQDAVPENWRDALGCPNLQAEELINAKYEEGAHAPYPPLQDAERGRDLFRAFIGLALADVRVVVIGQDPYTEPDRATGRSFEDGVAEQLSETTRPALRCLVQSAIDPCLVDGRENWRNLCAKIGAPPPTMSGFFDRLQEQGVLFINASWTYTHKKHQDAHKELWRPVTERLLEQIAAAPGGTVFLLLGGDAQSFFNKSVPEPDDLPNAAPVCHPHPTAFLGPTYFNGVNPLSRVNQALVNLGADEIDWWPFPKVDAT